MLSLRGGSQKNISFVFFLGKIPKIKIFRMVASEHPEAIEGRGQLISAEVPDHEEAAGGGSIDDYNYASDE